MGSQRKHLMELRHTYVSVGAKCGKHVERHHNNIVITYTLYAARILYLA